MVKKVKKVLPGETFDKYTLSTPKKEEEGDQKVNFPAFEVASESFWKKGKGTFWAAVMFSGLFLSLVGGFLIFVNITGSNSGTNNYQPAELSTSPSEPPVLAVPDKGSLKVEVLNGAGVPGTAAKAKTFLENAGYKDISTANAGNFNFKTTLVEVKESKKDFGDVLVNDLSSGYSASTSSAFLSEAGAFDAVVTVGAK